MSDNSDRDSSKSPSSLEEAINSRPKLDEKSISESSFTDDSDIQELLKAFNVLLASQKAKGLAKTSVSAVENFSLNRKDKIIYIYSNEDKFYYTMIQFLAHKIGYTIETRTVENGKLKDDQEKLILRQTPTSEFMKTTALALIGFLQDPPIILEVNKVIPIIYSQIQRSVNKRIILEEIRKQINENPSEEEKRKLKKAEKEPGVGKEFLSSLAAIAEMKSTDGTYSTRFLSCATQLLQLNYFYIIDPLKLVDLNKKLSKETKRQSKGVMIKSIKLHKIWTFKPVLSSLEQSIINSKTKFVDIKEYRKNYDSFIKGDISKKRSITTTSEKVTRALGRDVLQMIYARLKQTNQKRANLAREKLPINYDTLKPQGNDNNWEPIHSLGRLHLLWSNKEYNSITTCFRRQTVGILDSRLVIDVKALTVLKPEIVTRSEWNEFLQNLGGLAENIDKISDWHKPRPQVDINENYSEKNTDNPPDSKLEFDEKKDKYKEYKLLLKPKRTISDLHIMQDLVDAAYYKIKEHRSLFLKNKGNEKTLVLPKQVIEVLRGASKEKYDRVQKLVQDLNEEGLKAAILLIGSQLATAGLS